MDGPKRMRSQSNENDDVIIDNDKCSRRRLDNNFDDLHTLADVFISAGVTEIPTVVNSTTTESVEVTNKRIIKRFNRLIATNYTIIIRLFLIIIKILNKNSVIRDNILTILVTVCKNEIAIDTEIIVRKILGIYYGPTPKNSILIIMQQLKGNYIQIGPMTNAHALTHISRILFSLLFAISNSEIRLSILDEIKTMMPDTLFVTILTYFTDVRLTNEDAMSVVYPVVQDLQVLPALPAVQILPVVLRVLPVVPIVPALSNTKYTNKQIIESINELFAINNTFVGVLLKIIIMALSRDSILCNCILYALPTFNRNNTAIVMSKIIGVYNGPTLPDNSPIHQIVRQIISNGVCIGPMTSPTAFTNLARTLFSLFVVISNTSTINRLLNVLQKFVISPKTENALRYFTSVKINKDDENKIVYPTVNTQVLTAVCTIQPVVRRVTTRSELISVVGIACVDINPTIL